MVSIVKFILVIMLTVVPTAWSAPARIRDTVRTNPCKRRHTHQSTYRYGHFHTQSQRMTVREYKSYVQCMRQLNMQRKRG